MTNNVYLSSFFIQVEIKKKCYWKCPSNGPNHQIKSHPTRWHYPLITYFFSLSFFIFFTIDFDRQCNKTSATKAVLLITCLSRDLKAKPSIFIRTRIKTLLHNKQGLGCNSKNKGFLFFLLFGNAKSCYHSAVRQ